MSALSKSLDDYLKVRRALGYKMTGQEAILRNLIDLAEQERAKFITIDLALRCARRPANGATYTWSHRMTSIRLFAASSALVPVSMASRMQPPPSPSTPNRARRSGS